MKSQNDSAQLPSYSIEELNQELQSLNQAKQAAIRTGDDTAPIEESMQKVTRELRRRSGEKVPTEEEIEQTKIAVEKFLQAIDLVPEDQKMHINSSKFDGPIGVPVSGEDSEQ